MPDIDRFTSTAIHVFTRLADDAVVAGAVALVALALLIFGERRAAAWWLIAVAAALFAVLIAKIVFIPCGHLLPWLDVRSPSGHACAAVAAYGGLAVLATRSMESRRLGTLLILAAAIAAVAVGVSRVAIGAHTVAEVVFGGVLGLLSPLILSLRRDLALRRPPLWGLAAVLVIVVVVAARAPGFGFSLEPRIDALARQIAGTLRVCSA